MITATSVASDVLYVSSNLFRLAPGITGLVSQVNGLGEAEKLTTHAAAGETVAEVVGDAVVSGLDVVDVPGLVDGVLDVLAVLVGACEPFAELAAVPPCFGALDASVDWSDAAATPGWLSSLPLASTATRTPVTMINRATRPPTNQRVRFDLAPTPDPGEDGGTVGSTGP